LPRRPDISKPERSDWQTSERRRFFGEVLRIGVDGQTAVEVSVADAERAWSSAIEGRYAVQAVYRVLRGRPLGHIGVTATFLRAAPEQQRRGEILLRGVE
jgi:hypothetical protein